MASGDIKQFGMWKCINSSNAVSYKTGGYWPYSIYYSEYSNGVTLVDYDSSKCSDDPIEWIEYSYNGKTVYIQNKLFFYSISIAESLRMCSNNIYIDGVKYKLSFMPKEFWTNLPSSICTLFKTDTSKKFYTNSPFYTDSTSYYYSVHFDGNVFSSDSESIGENTIDETYAFVPVLVQDNSFNDGNTVQFGRWITDTEYYIYDDHNEIDFSYYGSAELDSDYTGSNALTWISTQIDGKDCYIAQHTLFNYISYNKAYKLCNNTYTINGNKYKLAFLTRSQWESLPSSVYSNLEYPVTYGAGRRQYIFTNENTNINLYGVYRASNNDAFSSELIPTENIADFDTVSGYVYFAPVLVSSNDVPDGTVVKIGAITLDGTLQTQQESNEYINQYTSTNTMPEVSLVNTSDESKKWSWLKFTDGGIKKYICTSGIFLGCSYDGLIKSIKTVTIENTIYELRFPTYDEFVALAKANLLGKINNYMDNGHNSSYHVITSSGGYASFLVNSQNISSQIDSLGFTGYPDNNFSVHHLVIPILVERGVPDGSIVEMGMTYDFNNGYNFFSGMETTYPVDGFTRVYDISADVNIVRTLKILDYNSSYTQEPPMEWVAYNYQNKLYYISRTTFIRGYIQDTFDICNNNKTIYLNGKYYEMTTMPIEFWTGLPSSVKDNMEIVNLNMHTDSEVQVSTSSESMQTGYRTVSFDTNEIKFVESRPVVSGIQGEAGCAFIPVLVQIDNDSTVETVKMGMLIDHEFRIERGTTADHDFCMSDNTYADNYDGVNYTFATASTYEKEHDMEWEWIRVIIDGTLMYISTTNSFLAYPIGYYYNNIKDRYICIDNKYYIFRLLSENQWKSLPTHVLNKIDWLNSNGYSTYTLTSSSTAIRYNPTNNTWDGSMSYDKTSTSIISGMGCIPVLEPIDSGIVKMGIVTTYNSGYDFSLPATNSNEYIIFSDTGNNNSRILNWTLATLNDKTVLIANDFLSTDMSLKNIKSYIDKIVYFNGTQYKIKILSQEQWRNLPASVLNNINFSYGSTNYYTYTSSTDSSGNHIFLTRNSNGTFVTKTASNTNTSTIDNCGLLLVLEYDGTGVDHIKLGALTRPNGLKEKKNCSYDGWEDGFNTGGSNSSLVNYNFTDTDIESYKWPWIKTEFNGDTILFSKMSVGPERYLTLIENGIVGREYTLENNKYQLIIMSSDEFKQLDVATLNNIDFGYGCSAPFDMFTNEATGTTTNDTVKTIHYNAYPSFGSIGFIESQIEVDTSGGRMAYYPILKLMNKPPTISGIDSNLGDKTQAFSIEYTVDDTDSGDTLTVTEKLNGTTIRTINSAVRNQKYYFDITSSMFANLTLYETNTVEITVNDGIATATRTYTFRKTNTAPVINYTGNDNLGIISSKPTIKYTVTDAEGDEITITERLNGKVLQTYTVSSGTECTVNIPNMSWLGCGNTTSTIEINARDSAGGSSNKTITFTRAIDRIEVITNPIKTDKAVTKISLEVGWNTEGASGQVFVCNNAYDESPTWEDMTSSVGSSLVYNLTNTTKTAAEWGISVKAIVKKDGGSTGEVSLYSIKGTYE